MEQLAHGQVEVLGDLYLRHGAMVERAVRRFAPGIAAADLDELVQDTFLALKESAAHYADRERFKSWLYGIAVQKTRNWHRNMWIRQKLLRQHTGQPVGIALAANRSPEYVTGVRQLLEQALERLPKNQRDVLLLHEIEGFDGKEIAEILGIRVNAVWTRLHRARRRILEIFGSEAEELRSNSEGER